MTYKQGAEKIKEEKRSLSKQSGEWLQRGLVILGGLAMISTDILICTNRCRLCDWFIHWSKWCK
ncbi:hypothetical protein DKK70_08795 [Gilliamella apicola]|uniref:Uncharacterized protein n=1 Tax=Gilliamella apicola TaxID=1196095 RepID=A0A2V4E5B8_9GAMM|nr:hypothetical protein DKK70_08795 [Gilliamella apicola]